MRISLRAFIATISTLGIIGIVGTSLAAPDGSQRLRGLGDRVFLVTATITVDRLTPGGFLAGFTLTNCYIFKGEADADGYNWFESAVPSVRGTWAQDSNGAKTSYAVEAINVDNGDQITQWGRVTPARGKGVLQLEVDTFLDVIPYGGAPDLEFLSVGEEIDESEAEIKCPDSIILMPPA